jgi:hypothetical protein
VYRVATSLPLAEPTFESVPILEQSVAFPIRVGKEVLLQYSNHTDHTFSFSKVCLVSF